MPTPAPIQPRQPDLARASRKPDKKELVDPEDVAGVEYGTTAKTDPRGTAAKTGTDALKIPLNPGNEAGADSGGMNV
jgi:hypothetical protein